VRRWRSEFLGLAFLALLAAGCASNPVEVSPVARTPPAPRCESGTLGLETGPILRAARAAMPPEAEGAVVLEVLPGGPAAAAGILKGDLLLAIGKSRIADDCAFVDAAFGRACENVRVVIRRAGKVLETTLDPVDEVPFFERSCRAGVASACFRQGWLLWNQTRAAAERERALDLYATACQMGSATACAYEGLRLTEQPEQAGKERASRGVPILERACELGSGGGCTNLAFLYATGKVVPRDDRRATPLYEKGCELGDPRGCYNAGLMAEAGRGVAESRERAAARYEEACAGGSSAGCTNLGFLYEHGNGVKQDAERAVALYRRGCDGTSCEAANLTGCVNLGRAYRDGIGVAKDPPRAVPIFAAACEAEVNPEDVDAPANRSRACSLLGALYLGSDGVESDAAKARKLSELGCARGDAFGCFNSAVIHASGIGVPANASRAADFYELACKAGDGEGCFTLGKAFEQGSGVARDPRRAAELFGKACTLGFAEACKKKSR